MASEITYAEVKFKNESPAAVVKVPPETKKHEHHPQKCLLWLPWLLSLLLLLVCVALVVLLVVPFSHSADQPTALQQNFTEWWCVSTVPQGKERGWLCCPKGWKRFQGSCYYFSDDLMTWVESEQNCTGMGSHLVVINSEAEQVCAVLRQGPSSQGHKENYYIGLRAQEVGQWHWVDQTPLNVMAAFWRSGEPSNTTDEPCVVIHRPEARPNNWNDARCERHNRICEAAAVTV
ncbi:CLC4A protein, partial [Bucorvus abyssinicus]|nr:CLC4A protein [Bucorvus abyssinicus]